MGPEVCSTAYPEVRCLSVSKNYTGAGPPHCAQAERLSVPEACRDNIMGLWEVNLLTEVCPTASWGQGWMSRTQGLLRASVGYSSENGLLSCFLGPQEDVQGHPVSFQGPQQATCSRESFVGRQGHFIFFPLLLWAPGTQGWFLPKAEGTWVGKLLEQQEVEQTS